MDYELTILMPCLNEAETLGACIEKAKDFLKTHQINGEILIADNGSTDGSQEIARAHDVHLIHVSTKGYGAALKSGIHAARGRYIVMGDADNSYDFLNLMPFLTKLRQGYALVMGNRFKGGISKGAMPFLNRFLGNPVLSFMGRVFFKSKIGDFHCGLRGFDRDIFQKLELQGEGMEFASEMVIKASLHQVKTTEVPIQLFPDGRSRHSHLRPWRDGWRHLRLLLVFSPRWLFYYPGLFLIGLGFLLMSLLVLHPLSIGHATLDIHTLLFSSVFIIVGLQAVFFALFANTIQRICFNMGKHKKFSSLFTLERGLALGCSLVIGGVTVTLWGFWHWAVQQFGNLEPSEMMRLLIPASTSIMMGMQFIFGSFFMSLLNVYYQKSNT